MAYGIALISTVVDEPRVPGTTEAYGIALISTVVDGVFLRISAGAYGIVLISTVVDSPVGAEVTVPMALP